MKEVAGKKSLPLVEVVLSGGNPTHRVAGWEGSPQPSLSCVGPRDHQQSNPPKLTVKDANQR